MISALWLLAPLAVQAEEAKPWEGLSFNAAPKPLAPGAVTEDWPRFLGPSNAPVSKETSLIREFTAGGPAKVWSCVKGEGYASPAISRGKLVLFHRVNGRERIDCLDAVNGRRFWFHEYPVDYRDDFGYGSGPRCGPVIGGGKVVTFGVTSWLKCFDLETGKVEWQHDCENEYSVPKYFFGSGASPLIQGEKVIVNLGGAGEQCVSAFDLKTGNLSWTAKHEWGQSYASPIPATLHGRDRVLVFAGGKSTPSTGGLLNLDPATGAPDDTFFWRARRFPSVNASSPVLCEANHVFISQAYVDRESPCNGGVMLNVDEKGKFTPLWKAPDFGCHWNTPVYHDGHLYGFSGEKDNYCKLVCCETATGTIKWSEKFSWPLQVEKREIPMGLYRGSLLKVGDRFLCLGEWGTLCWLDLTPSGAKILTKHQPFIAQQSWTLPALSHGLLYVSQNEPDTETDGLNKTPPSLICYDLRANAPAK
ncbi:MAG TPA: PQQ-binding-like beta-propeller repeat protein [Verrucomicrobiales bacterium]|nr:PQQ-binding-like beta-propeller repeat protein [Verrucomicrobiales bacterium]